MIEEQKTAYLKGGATRCSYCPDIPELPPFTIV